MNTIEQKEKDTIELRKLTRFQKKQVLSLVDRFLEENEESEKESFPACPKYEMEHRRRREDTAEREVYSLEKLQWFKKNTLLPGILFPLRME